MTAFGISTGWGPDTPSDMTHTQRQVYFAAIKAAGFSKVRMNYSGNATQTGDAIADAQSAGLSVLLIIIGSATDTTTTYAAKCSTAVTSWSSQVSEYELMNEPNLDTGWANGAAYAAVAKAGADAIHSAQPAAKVLLGGIASFGAPGSGDSRMPTNWLTSVYTLGAGHAWFDHVAYHPYAYNTGASGATVFADTGGWKMMNVNSPSLRSIMTANSDSAKKIYVTETGAPSWLAGSGFPSGSTFSMTEAEVGNLQGLQIDDFLLQTWAGDYYVYSFRDDPTWDSTREGHFGLVYGGEAGTTDYGHKGQYNPVTTRLPFTYAFQWKRVDPNTAVESNIPGATDSSYVLQLADAGFKVKATVTASNASGSTPADSGQTSIITKIINLAGAQKWRRRVVGGVVAVVLAGGGLIYNQINPGGGGGSSTLNCFPSPKACGYPDPTFSNVGATPGVGVPAGTSLTASGSITTSSAGQTINAKDVTGSITVANNNVTISNTQVTTSGSGARTIVVNTGVAGLTIRDSTLKGSGTDDPNSIEAGVYLNNNASVTMTRDYVYNASNPVEAFAGSTTNVNDSYFVASGYQTGAHFELIYVNSGTVNVQHSTLLNPNPQTAIIFGDILFCTAGPATNSFTIQNSLVGGGGFLFYPDSCSTTVGSSVTNISNNHFARCLGTLVHNNGGDGGLSNQGNDCANTTTTASFTQPALYSTVSVTVSTTANLAAGYPVYVYTGGFYRVSSVTDGTHVVLKNIGVISSQNRTAGTSIASGSQVTSGDSHGYSPLGGYFGPDTWTWCGANGSQTWSGNVWDDNGVTVGC